MRQVRAVSCVRYSRGRGGRRQRPKTGKRFLIFPRYQHLDAVRKLVQEAFPGIDWDKAYEEFPRR
jgi:hypothetical protein